MYKLVHFTSIVRKIYIIKIALYFFFIHAASHAAKRSLCRSGQSNLYSDTDERCGVLEPECRSDADRSKS